MNIFQYTWWCKGGGTSLSGVSCGRGTDIWCGVWAGAGAGWIGCMCWAGCTGCTWWAACARLAGCVCCASCAGGVVVPGCPATGRGCTVGGPLWRRLLPAHSAQYPATRAHCVVNQPFIVISHGIVLNNFARNYLNTIKFSIVSTEYIYVVNHSADELNIR